jgi:DNA-binding transcriptional LysR family regulator
MQQLRAVVAVAEEGRFTRAAGRLHLAQPSVSAQVRSLERELGTELFVRDRRGAVLTAAGERFLPWARQALADCEAGRAAVRELLGLRAGRLALGSTPSLTRVLLPPALAAFHARYPGVEVVLHQAGSANLVADLENGLLDLALIILPVTRPTIATQALVEEELVLAVGLDHPLSRLRTVRLEQLAGTPLVMFREGYDLRRTTLAACREAGFAPVLAVEGGEMDSVLALTAEGLGAAVVPSSVIEPGGPLRGIRFTGTRLRRTIGLATRTDRPLPLAAQAFRTDLDHLLSTRGWPGRPRTGLRVLPPRGGAGFAGPAGGDPPSETPRPARRGAGDHDGRAGSGRRWGEDIPS